MRANRQRSGARHALAALAAVALCPGPAGAPVSPVSTGSAWAERPAGSIDMAIQEVLVSGWMVAGWPEEQVVCELASLGSEALPRLFAIHAGLDRGLWEGEGLDFEHGPEQGAALVGRALCRMPHGAVLAYLRRSVQPVSASEARLAAIDLYAELGGTEELGPCLRLMASWSEEERNEPALRRRLPEALAAYFARLPEAARMAAESCANLPAHVRRTVREALLALDHPAAVGALPLLIGAGPKEDARVIERLGVLGDRYPWQLTDGDRELVWALLVHDDWSIRRAACVLAAQWQAVELFDELLGMLEGDTQPAVRRAAQWALHALSGTRLELDAPAWERWLKTQEEAWKSGREELLSELESEDPAVVGGALRRAGRLHLYRHEVAPQVAEVLFTQPGLAEAVSAVLLELDSRNAVPTLVDAMESAPDDRARRVAWMTLKRLTGRDLRVDDPAWGALLAQ